MSARFLKILGSSSQVPTRERNHNGYFLKWDEIGVLTDPGEGTQRQMIYFNVSPSSITHIFISHFHGDHCLGLPGVLQRLSLAQINHPIHIFYPASGSEYLERLCACSSYYDNNELVLHPVIEDSTFDVASKIKIEIFVLDHVIDCLGFRLKERDSCTLIPELLDRFQVIPELRMVLLREGKIETDDGMIQLSDVSVLKPGQSFAYVSDTKYFDSLVEYCQGVDLLLCEATFRDQDQSLADEYKHLTARQAGLLANSADVRQMVITHFSQRYKVIDELIDEATRNFPNTTGAVDGMEVPVPKRERKLVKC